MAKEKKTIMIVDDETITRRMLVSFVSRMGYGYIEARDGLEAVETLKTTPVDLIVLDLNMPKVSGYSILGAFEQTGINVPVIICSGTLHLSSNVEFIHGKKNYDFMSKPVTFDKFIEVVRSALGETADCGVAQQAPAAAPAAPSKDEMPPAATTAPAAAAPARQGAAAETAGQEPGVKAPAADAAAAAKPAKAKD